MKIHLLLSFMLLSSVALFSQDVVKDMPKSEACESGKQQAEADFKRGIRKIYVFGLVIDVKYCRVLREKYNIEAQSKGCLILPELKCYSDCMESLITQERGFGFFEKVRLETDTKSVIPKMF